MLVIRSLRLSATASVFLLVGAPLAFAAPAPDPGSIKQRPRNETPNMCEAPLGRGTNHGSVNSQEIWTAAASPHLVNFNININAPVTIQPCAVVRIIAGGSITITKQGALYVAGAANYPVIIQPQALGREWSTISNVGGVLSLSHAILAGGGAPLNYNVAYIGAVQMLPSTTAGMFHVDDVEIIGSRSDGVFIDADVGFDATSQNLRVNHSVGFPIHVVARVLGSVPSGTYTLNGHDAIAIAGVGKGGPLRNAQTMHDRGVPYHIGTGQELGQMDVSAQPNGPAAVLTIEPGVRILFPPGGSLNINGNHTGGAIVAIGTAAQPIVFTSDQGPASVAGNWLGIGFNDPVSTQNVMQHVRVEFAGGATVTGSSSCPMNLYNGPNYAAIRILGRPSSQFITDSEILYSARNGIDRGWRDDLQPDFMLSNSFNALANCKQTLPSKFNGWCPAPNAVPCP